MRPQRRGRPLGAAAPWPMLVAPGLATLTVDVTAVRVLVMPMMHASICSASCIDRPCRSTSGDPGPARADRDSRDPEPGKTSTRHRYRCPAGLQLLQTRNSNRLISDV